MRPITKLIVHTNGVAGRTVAQIRLWHLAKGWADIGYHWAVYEDGSIHPGRPERKPGAHVQGMNLDTLGVVFIGNGDKTPFTPAQMKAGGEFLAAKLRQFGLKPADVLGHRETGRTKKTCPGKCVNMDLVRAVVQGAYDAQV